MSQNKTHTHLPLGLPDHIYGSWHGALREMRSSSSTAIGRDRHQFCCGYLQALQDSQMIEPHLCRFLNAEVQAMWVETSASLAERGL